MTATTKNNVIASTKVRHCEQSEAIQDNVDCHGDKSPRNDENRAGYKKTELGWIPEEWNFPFFSEITNKIIDGTHSTPTYIKSGIPFLRVTDIQGSEIDMERLKYIPENEHRELLKRCNPEKGDILYSKNGTLGLPKIVNWEWEFSVFVSLALIKPKHELIFNEFLSQMLQSNIIWKQIYLGSKEGSVNNLHLIEIRKFLIPLPCMKEQQKIAQILSCWDKSIEKTENLITAKTQLKKALMQRLLTGKIRFGEFAEQKWIKVSLKDKFERVTRKNNENNSNVLTISAQQGLISQEEYYKKRIASKDTSHYILVKKGEFAYNKSYSTGYPMGAIKKLDRYESGVVSSLYICFALKNNNMCSSFFAHYFEAGMLNQEIQNIAQEGARNHGLLNIGIIEFFNTLIKIPTSGEEQQKIAGVLNACDKEIELLNKQLDALKEQKKGLMQKLLTGQIRVIPRHCEE